MGALVTAARFPENQGSPRKAATWRRKCPVLPDRGRPVHGDRKGRFVQEERGEWSGRHSDGTGKRVYFAGEHHSAAPKRHIAGHNRNLIHIKF